MAAEIGGLYGLATLGGGLSMPLSPAASVFLEARIHHAPRAPTPTGTGRTILPVTVGFVLGG